MIAVWFARIVGVGLIVLSIVGFFFEGHLFGFLTVDLSLDIGRVVLGLMLCAAGFLPVSRMYLNVALGIFATTYLLSALTWFMDREVYGLVPSGLTVPDLVAWIVFGVAALGVMLLPEQTAHRRDDIAEGMLAPQRDAESGRGEHR
ncbi:hypothetical protein M4I32_07830 [Microbacterium sp. LRZ72]|uniref:hypothetical protein n=1 Tax=Microbacterium sp. LRZ72 TaxID=2942481 RepID=UPI0029B349E1|nr:hypothetical protein [Microbacterium sp. LRZ72]MDX2376707.1 hypothetical protein [Microbacterium sp. LRZ72]